MKVGIGLPLVSRGAQPADAVTWSREAEDAGFQSVALLDRLIWDNYDPIVTLAVAAGATSRIGLVTAVLIAPLHPAAVLAKQLVSLDNLSGGRLTVGVGLGGHPRDYEAAGAQWQRRGRTLDEMLVEIRQLWSGRSPYSQPAVTEFDRFGPLPIRPGGPRILIGGSARSAERSARLGDGFISGWATGLRDGRVMAHSGNTKGGTIGPDLFADKVDALWRAWADAGRDGQPYVAAAAYYSLAAGTAQVTDYLGTFYRHDVGLHRAAVEASAMSADAVVAYAEAYRADGADEVLFMPASKHPEELRRLADALADAQLLDSPVP